MDNRTDAVHNGRTKVPPKNLPCDCKQNDNSDDRNLGQTQTITFPSTPKLMAPTGQRKNQQDAYHRKYIESNSNFIMESVTFMDENLQDSALVSVSSRPIGDSDVGFQSLQAPRHLLGTVTMREAVGADDDDGGSLNDRTGRVTPHSDDGINLHQPMVPEPHDLNAIDDQLGNADPRISERQRFLNFAAMSQSTDNVPSGWEPPSPNYHRIGNVKQDRQKQQAERSTRLQQTYLQPYQGSLDSYQRQSHESAIASTERNVGTRPSNPVIQSAIRIMDYSQRQKVRQRQLFHNKSKSQGSTTMNTDTRSPTMNTDTRLVNSNRAQILSNGSAASQLAHPQLVQQNGSPYSNDEKQAPAVDGSASREKRSHSFDTAMSMTTLDQGIGDIVNYTQYPYREDDADEQDADYDESTSRKFVQKKWKHRLSHSRSHSSSDTISLERRRTNNKGAITLHSKVNAKVQQRLNTAHQQISNTRLKTVPSFDSPNDDKATARKWSYDSNGAVVEDPRDRNKYEKRYGKHRRQNRSINIQTVDAGSTHKLTDGYDRFNGGEDNNSDSDNSKSAFDSEEENEALFKRRQRDDSTVRGPNARKKRNTISPFANIGKSSAEKAARSTFLPTSYGPDDQRYSTFVCPRCKTRQREFFTIENVAGRLEGPGSYLALYFSVYVICSLFIFGLEEGWKPLDCIYFAVITLTTAGLGDFVPTSRVNKIVCSIFIYFGVACIGLLLGSYIASMLDHRAIIDRKSKQIDACPNCAKIKTMNEAVIARNKAALEAKVKYLSERGEKRYKSSVDEQNVITPSRDEKLKKSHVDEWDTRHDSASPAVSNSSSLNSRLLGSPVTRQILGRQKHTRHASIDISTSKLFSDVLPTSYGTSTVKKISEEVISHHSSNQVSYHGNINPTSNPNKLRTIASSENLFEGTSSESDAESTVLSSSTLSSTEAIWDGNKSQLNAAKYVFVTLRLALFNSMVIIAVGCLGFHFIEGFNLVDSWYFTTVLLTTVGYGDIVPVTNAGKLFATIYILVAGTLLLNNMSSISMIPLELRRRRIERAVLTQFGDHLDDAALRELATGPLVQRLRLATNRTDGLDECTREMFSLAMLVRLGKVTEHDIRGTFSCFRHLDVNNEGVLNSKSIIAGMIAKQRQSMSYVANPPPPPPPITDITTQKERDKNLKVLGLMFRDHHM